MKFIPVKSIPEPQRKPQYSKLQAILEDFVHSSTKIVKVDYRHDEYTSVGSCACSIRKMTNYHGFPIHVIMRGDDIYLKKEN